MSSPESPGRQAATSLSRSPLLSQLGRVDLARLAGELEEQHFKPGDVIVREGDPGDAFYVIKAGEAGVTVGSEAFDGGSHILLRAGECFGEMAPLGDTPRTASVVARTELTVWRLSRERFDAIVTRERAIARSIERTLIQRLALTSRELSAMRRAAHRLALSALRRLSPGALGLLRVLVTRPAWEAAVLARVAARVGHGDALAELEQAPGFVVRAGDRLAADEATMGLIGTELGEPEDAWLGAASEELARAGDAIGAVEVALRAGAPSRAADLLAAEEARLVDAASVEDVDRWVARAADPALAARFAELRPRIAAGRRAERHGRGPGVAARARSPLSGLRRWLNVRRPTAVAATVLAAVVFVLGCTLPEPGGLGRAGFVTLAALVATVPLLVANVLPDYVVMLLLATVLVVPGLVTPADILGGFATPAWLMILTLLVVGTAVARSGLMLRLVLLSLERLPGNYVTQSLVLSSTGVVLTAGITSGATRIALGVPIARALAESLGLGRHSGGAAAIGLLTLFTFIQLDTLFLTGSFTALVVHDLLPDAVRAQVTWWRWFVLTLPPALIMFGLYYAFLMAYFRPRSRRQVDVRAVRLQEEVLGRLTRAEIWSVVVLVALVVGFATRPYHGVAPAWLAVAVFVVLFVVGVLDHTALHTGGSLGLLVYSGVILGLGAVFASLGIDTWLSSLVRSGMPAMVTDPYGFVLVLALTAFALRFFVPWMTLSTLLALVAIPLAEGMGFPPFIPVLVALIAGDHSFLPYVNTGYSMVYFASDGELFSHEQARTPLMVESLIRIGALVASVPIWRFLGVL
jgi:CRP-like cAMP-binding protein/di/tricarboxylate transporter